MSETTDYVDARDIAFGLMLAAWDAACQSVVGNKCPALYQGVLEVIPPADTFWTRLSMNTVVSKKTNISGLNRHTAKGQVFAQMFFPLSVKGSWDKGLRIAQQLKNALASPSSSGTVLFRDPRQNELTPDESHHRLNVVAEFEYDEIFT